MKTIFFILTVFLCVLLSLVSSCDSDDDTYVMQTPPIGAVFEDSSVAIKFENTKFVSFICLESNHKDSGLAQYTFKDGVVTFINPYSKRPSQEDTTEPYFLKFEGKFISPKRLEASYFFAGKHEMIQVVSSPHPLYRTSPD